MNNDIQKGKNTAIVAYLTIIGSVIAIFMNQENNRSEFASFHIRQGLGISITFHLLAYFVGNIDSWMASSAFYLFYFTLWIYGFLGVIQNQKNEIPVLGAFFQKLFKSL
jgi:uncharacterized membrane protein